MRISDWSSDVCSSDLGFEEHLLDGRRLAAAADAYFYRVAQHRVAERTDGFREGGGEQQRLPVLRELLHDVAYLVLEAHVQHAVGLVEQDRKSTRLNSSH